MHTALPVGGAAALAESLAARLDEAALYLRLATLRLDVPLAESLDDFEWKGAPRADLEALSAELGESDLHARVPRWRD